MVGSSYTAKIDKDVNNSESYTTFDLVVHVLMRERYLLTFRVSIKSPQP